MGERGRIPGLRDIYSGFDASDGYDLRHPERWTRARFNKVQDAAKFLHYYTASPFKVVKPRTKAQRLTLRMFTQQADPNQRRYIVHVETPRFNIGFKQRPGKKFADMEIRRGPSGYGRMRFWFFRDYYNGGQPVLADEFIEATQNMLPDMPNWGYFSLWSATTGVIGIPQPKNSLVRAFQRYFEKGESFGPDKEKEMDFLQAWVLQGNKKDWERTYIARQKRRASRVSKWSDRQRKLRKLLK